MADVISRLKLESGEFDSKIKRAGQELLAYSEHCRKMGLEMGYANRDAKDFAKQLGNMQTTTNTARGKIGELTEAFVNLKAMYKSMTDEEKKGEFGRNLSASLDQLKNRIDAAKKDFADIQKELNGGNSKFGEFGNVIDTLGSKMGMTGNLTEMLTSKTALMTGAVGASIAIVTKATEAWAGYNAELAKQDQITTVTTGLKGDDADRMTDKMRALSDTYNVDFREAVNAANTLMTQFGQSGDEATQLIKDGMQGMIQGDGPKLLSMIQQYAPAFRDAGVSASQLVAVIHNSEGGIFTDQNMNAIVMGIKNIRLMTKATSDALAQLGIDGEKMSEQLSNGSLTIFDALKQIANQIQSVDSNSKAAGEVMQQVFGRQGAMAGTKLGEAIATLNTNLEETKKQTGEVGDALADLQTANERLNTAIRDCFEYDGWDQMANGIRSNLITALASVLEKLAAIKTELQNLFNGTSLVDVLKGKIAQGQSKANNPKLGLGGMNWHAQNTGPQGSYTVVTDENGNTISAKHQDLTQQPTTPLPRRRTGGGSGKGGTTTTTPAQQAAKSIEAAEQEYARALEKAALEVQGGTITEAQQKQKQLQATEALWTAYGKASDTVGGTNTEYKKRQDELGQQIVSLGGETKSLQDAQKQAEEAYRLVAAQTQKMATAQEEANRAIGSGDLKAFYAADSKLTAAGGKSAATGMDMSQVFGATQANVDAFIANLKQQISQSELGTDLYNNLTAQLADTQALSNLLQVAIKNGIDPAQIGLVPEEFWKKIFGDNPGDYINPETWKAIVDNLNEYIHKNGGSSKKVKLDVNTGNVTEKEDKTAQEQLTAMNTMINSLGSIASGVQNLGIEVPAGIMQGIAVLQTIMGIVSAIQTMQTVGTFLGIFHNGGIVHAANGWAGTVPGNSYSNDQIPIMANAGEVVLTHAMAGNLASQLNDGGMQNIQLEAVVTGEQIMLASNNRGRRTGRGEIVQSRRVR